MTAPGRANGARTALALLLAINMFNYIDRYVLAAVLPRIHDAMLANDPRSGQKEGWLATAFLVAYMVLSPLFGWLADRTSRWALVGLGVMLWSLASGASGLAGFFTALLITRMFVGVGEAAYGPVAPTIISDLYPIQVRGKVLAWFYMAIPVGSALGYALGGALATPALWRWAFFCVVPPGILLGILCLFMRDTARGSSNATSSHAATLRDYATLLRNRSYVLNCLGMAALTFAIGGISYWMPSYIYDYRMGRQGSLSRINLIFGGITVVTGIVATLLGGMLGDALRQKIRGAYFLVSAGGLFMAFPLVIAMLIVPFPWAWGLVFLAEFCLFLNTGPSNTALANVTHPGIRSTAFAVNIFFIHAFGDAISPPIIGALSDCYNRNVGFAAVAVVILAGAVFWLVGARYLDEDTAQAAHQLDRL